METYSIYKEEKVTICRFCFKECDDNSEAIGENFREVLDALLLELDLAISEDPVVCKTCAGNLKETFKFKSTCLQIEDCINSFMRNKDNAKLDLTELYLSNNGDKSYVKIPEGHTPCRLCMKLLKYSSRTSLNDDVKDIVTVKSILEKYFPELELTLTKDPSICMTCHSFLQTHYVFIRSCLDIEEKIKIFCEVEGTNSKNQVKLNNVLEFMSTNIMGYKNNHCSINIVDNLKENKVNGELESENEGLAPMENGIKYEEVDVKLDRDNMNRCRVSTPGPQQKITHLHAEPLEAKRIKREIYPFTTSSKNSLKPRMLVHEDPSNITMYKCEECSYKTKYKRDLKRHLLVHKDTSEATMHKCELCPFETKHKWCVKQHMLVHKDPSEITTYHCEVCVYVAKRKNDLKKHMIIHKDATEVTMYKCGTCGLETRHRYYLQKHIQLHQPASEIQRIKCELCKYEAKDKKHLKQHTALVHKAPDVPGCKCEICGHESKCKSYLKSHMLIHKDISETPLYKCDICGHSTKYRNSLKLHMLVHKESSEVPMYKCETCAYKTKYKQCIRRHMLTHRDKGIENGDLPADNKS